jgi:hypothetical protein
MTPELPRRIWVFEDDGGGIPRSGIWIDEQSECPDGSPEYIRADIAAAMVAAERDALFAALDPIIDDLNMTAALGHALAENAVAPEHHDALTEAHAYQIDALKRYMKLRGKS